MGAGDTSGGVLVSMGLLLWLVLPEQGVSHVCFHATLVWIACVPVHAPLHVLVARRFARGPRT